MLPNEYTYRGISVSRAYDLGCAAADLPDPRMVDTTSERPDLGRPALAVMQEACELPDDLLGGNRAMRKKCHKWLPPEEEESQCSHQIRVSRSTCFPFYRDTLLDLAARPFIREMTWEQEPPPAFAEFLQDVDGTGKSLTVFARDTLLNAMHRGMDHVLVDTSSDSGESGAATDSRRVYAQRIDSLSMLDIRDEADAAGRKHVTYCRFVLRRVKDTNTFAQESETVIVELEHRLDAAKPGWRVEWRFDEKAKKWLSSPRVEYSPPTPGIPLFTLYTQQTGPFAAEPVLEDLAWVNLAHYQSRSDHAHVMRIARLITLVTLGFPNPEPGNIATKGGNAKIVLGPLCRINSAKPPTEASVSFLEPNGKSIELSFQDMDQLADECKRLGARHLTSSTGNVTARAVTLDDAKSASNLQTFCMRLEVLLRQILEAVGAWLSAPSLPTNVQPRIHKDFQVTGNIEGGSRALQAVAPALSKRQLLVEATRYGILRPDFPVDENLDELKDEQAAIDKAIADTAGTPGGNDVPPADSGAAA